MAEHTTNLQIGGHAPIAVQKDHRRPPSCFDNVKLNVSNAQQSPTGRMGMLCAFRHDAVEESEANAHSPHTSGPCSCP